jgi:hypothetical protein
MIGILWLTPKEELNQAIAANILRYRNADRWSRARKPAVTERWKELRYR